tara:strand:+ start:698 stop:1042 length:345 start_codon:yes stop_codon:yes gene_type:complete
MTNTPAFIAKLRIVGNNSQNQNAPEKNVIIDFTCEEGEKAAKWILQAVDNAKMDGTKIRVYKSKSDYDEVAGFSLWGGMWGNSGRIQPMPHKEASERTVDVQANQPELPDDLPF